MITKIYFYEIIEHWRNGLSQIKFLYLKHKDSKDIKKVKIRKYKKASFPHNNQSIMSFRTLSFLANQNEKSLSFLIYKITLNIYYFKTTILLWYKNCYCGGRISIKWNLKININRNCNFN